MHVFRPYLNCLLPITTAFGLCACTAQAQVLEAGSDATIRDKLCVGDFCADDPTPEFADSFGTSLTLRDAGTRIDFEDTSTTGSNFPSNDWSIRINDGPAFGQEYFAVEDRTAGVMPFRIDAGAPANALYVDDTGQVGLGTALPTASLHIEDPIESSLRLRRNTSAGRNLQDWLIFTGTGGLFFKNDSGFIPISISSSAPVFALRLTSAGVYFNEAQVDYDFRVRSQPMSNALFVEGSSANVGIGTQTPATSLHITRDDGSASVLVENTGGDPGVPRELFKLSSNGGSYFTFENTSAGTTWYFNHENAAPNRFIIADAVADGPEFTLTAGGDVTIPGSFISGSTTLNVPDYVFEEGYALRPLSEVGAFIAENRHLPDVPSATEIAETGLDMTDMQMALLRKVEELTLYTLEQDAEIARLRRLEAESLVQAKALASFTARMEALERRLAE